MCEKILRTTYDEVPHAVGVNIIDRLQAPHRRHGGVRRHFNGLSRLHAHGPGLADHHRPAAENTALRSGEAACGQFIGCTRIDQDRVHRLRRVIVPREELNGAAGGRRGAVRAGGGNERQGAEQQDHDQPFRHGQFLSSANRSDGGPHRTSRWEGRHPCRPLHAFIRSVQSPIQYTTFPERRQGRNRGGFRTCVTQRLPPGRDRYGSPRKFRETAAGSGPRTANFPCDEGKGRQR